MRQVRQSRGLPGKRRVDHLRRSVREGLCAFAVLRRGHRQACRGPVITDAATDHRGDSAQRLPLVRTFLRRRCDALILLPVNTRLSPSEISRILESCDPSILVIGAQWRDLLERWNLPEQLKAVVWVGGVQNLPMDRRLYSLSYEAIVSGQPIHIPASAIRPPTIADPASVRVEIFCTSGTTGLPKFGAPQPCQCVRSMSRMTLEALGLDADELECWGHFGPMYHVGDVAFVWGGVPSAPSMFFIPTSCDSKTSRVSFRSKK